MKGKVKFFNAGKGFGFIAGEDGKEYFVHQTGLKDGVTLRENDAVTFTVEQGDRGPKAAKVALEGAAGKKAAKEESEEETEESEEESEEETEESEEESEEEVKEE